MDINEEILGMDLYEFLECDPTATDAKIKTAYRKKALLCHPDKHPDNADAAEMFKQLKSIVDLLLDQHKRACYDQQRMAEKLRKIDAQQRAEQQLFRQERMKQESERQKRAQERARQEACHQQQAQEEFQKQHKSQSESYRRQRAREESERLWRAHQNEPQGASYRDAGTSHYTPRQHSDVDELAATFSALNESHKNRMREQAKRRGMGRSKRPSCFSANLDPNCHSFWTYPRPTSTSSNLDPNSPVFHPRTMPGQTV